MYTYGFLNNMAWSNKYTERRASEKRKIQDLTQEKYVKVTANQSEQRSQLASPSCSTSKPERTFLCDINIKYIF